MARALLALLSGLLFGAGLTVSQMVNPAKILAFLDFAAIPSGGWDPSLALVMAGALGVTYFGYRLARGRERPILAGSYSLPSGSATLDRRLVGGALLFGAGWGLVGYCPGPALSSLVFGNTKTFVFVAAMLAGMLAYRLVEHAGATGKGGIVDA